jgi:hypothetical protein
LRSRSSDAAERLTAVLCCLLAISLEEFPLPITMTLRNKLNVAFILAFPTWVIFAFNLSRTQYVGLFLLLLFAPKAFWLSFDYLTGFLHVPLPNQAFEREGANEVETVS